MGEERDPFFKMLMKQMGVETPDEVKKGILSGDFTAVRSDAACWTSDGMFCFDVTSDGTTGPNWIKNFEEKHPRIGNNAKKVLNSQFFRPTHGVVYKVAILMDIPKDWGRRTSQNFCEYAKFLHLSDPVTEVACLVSRAATAGKVNL